MIPKNTEDKVVSIWEDFLKSNKKVYDKKGNLIKDIDESRIDSIKEIKDILNIFMTGDYSVNEFKTALDSYNKRNNYWGFTAAKGQMFFNQLTKTNESSLDKLTELLKDVIVEPVNLEDALQKIDKLEKFSSSIFKTAPDKRKAPNPASVGYFLSYFWQINNHEKWPVFYTSLINGFKELNIWNDYQTQKENYKSFYNLNQEIKNLLTLHAGREVSNWDVEHSFWNFTGNPNIEYKKTKPEIPIELDVEKEELISLKANFELSDYLIPKVANLVNLGSETEKSSSAKGVEFEKMVGEIFKLLDFEIEVLGQGTGRNPDIIIKFREENIAFIVDAKAYSSGYSLGIDDRAIKEYIHNYCPKLQKDGYKKIGFIIVSNSFKTSFDSFINDITWNTDIKRFVLLTSEALLYLLAYKTKDKISLSSIVESIVGFGNVITSSNVISKYEDI